MSHPIYAARLERCRAAMRRAKIETLLLTPGASMRYLTGFSETGYERLLALVVPGDGRAPQFLVPALNAEQARVNPAGVEAVRAWSDTEGWRRPLEELIGALGVGSGTVGVDDDMAARFVLPLMEIVPPALVRSAGELFAGLRSVKDAGEMDAMRRAAALTDRAFLAAAAACRPGVTEAEIARVVAQTITDGGGEVGFETIVGFGPNSALPHHRAGDRPVAAGDVALFDLGAKVGGYCGDITRVASMGAPAEEASAIYDIVYQAQARAAESVRPGVPASFVDAAARQVIVAAGYGDFFFHRTGHGIGLDDHEAPNIVHGNDKPLAPGNCFSIEPGVYLAGSFGVRLENIHTVTERGGECLNAPIPPRLTDVRELARAAGPAR